VQKRKIKRKNIYECKYDEQKINPALRVSTVMNSQHDKPNFFIFLSRKKTFLHNGEKCEKQAADIPSLPYVDIPENNMCIL
jgi:hypothetical protein